jgi:hypothetical protein
MRREKVLSLAAAVVLELDQGIRKKGEFSDTHTVRKVALRRRNAEREQPFGRKNEGKNGGDPREWRVAIVNFPFSQCRVWMQQGCGAVLLEGGILFVCRLPAVCLVETVV